MCNNMLLLLITKITNYANYISMIYLCKGTSNLYVFFCVECICEVGTSKYLLKYIYLY